MGQQATKTLANLSSENDVATQISVRTHLSFLSGDCRYRDAYACFESEAAQDFHTRRLLLISYYLHQLCLLANKVDAENVLTGMM